jgi:hypothetical protein
LVLLHFFELSYFGDFVAGRPIFGDEHETICEGFYEIEDASMFAWFSILGVGHYRRLCCPFCQLPPNSKMDYLVRII